MKIHSESRIHHPIDHVYDVYKNRMPALARYLPDIEEIRVEEREDLPDGTRLVNLWIAKPNVPAVAQKFVKPEMTRWTDRARWYDADHHAEWVLDIPSLRKHFRCSGRTELRADGERATRVLLTGELVIDLAGFPGIPSLFARKVAPAVEEFIVRLITPNLEKTNVAVEKLLDA